MSGVYIHIPFCKSRCGYCDFFSTTLLSLRNDYVSALIEEMRARRSYLTDEVSTIYFGGGTPSLLSVAQILRILSELRQLFSVAADAEITLEANPSDLNDEYLTGLRQAGINRLSIGVQSFDNRMLALMGRRHTADEARKAVKAASEAGFGNISIDLIYGLPGQTVEAWSRELEAALGMKVQHISTYCLTYESGTPFAKMKEAGKLQAADDDTVNEMYALLVKTLTDNGYEHYEVSNFALPEYYSRHNSAYWNSTPYLGIGAGAHSYNRVSRQWNQCQLEQYISAAMSHTLQPETETLTEKDKYNETVMLSLRTKAGISLSSLDGGKRSYCLKQADSFLQSGKLTITDNRLVATADGINILNIITEHLMQ